MKKIIFSLIFVVSTLFSFSEQVTIVDGSDMHLYTRTTPTTLPTIVEVTNGLDISSVGPAIKKVYLDTTSNFLIYDDLTITFDIIVNTVGTNGDININGQTILVSNTYTLNISTNTLDSLLFISVRNASFTISNLKIVGSNSVGIKNLEQRQLNLFTFGNTIKVNGQIDEKLKLNVFNILGQLVIQTDLKNEIETNVSTGVYILQVLDDHDNSIETKKVLLQN